MAVESFLVTALPRSADPAETVHVSLFVTPPAHPGRPGGRRRATSPTSSTGPIGSPAPRSAWWVTPAGEAPSTIPVTADLGALRADRVAARVPRRPDGTAVADARPDRRPVADVPGPPHAATCAARARGKHVLVPGRTAVRAGQRPHRPRHERDRARAVVASRLRVEGSLRRRAPPRRAGHYRSWTISPAAGSSAGGSAPTAAPADSRSPCSPPTPTGHAASTRGPRSNISMSTRPVDRAPNRCRSPGRSRTFTSGPRCWATCLPCCDSSASSSTCAWTTSTPWAASWRSRLSSSVARSRQRDQHHSR